MNWHDYGMKEWSIDDVRGTRDGPIYIEGRRPVGVFVGVLLIVVGVPLLIALQGGWDPAWIVIVGIIAWVPALGRLISMWRVMLNHFSLTITENGIIDSSSYGFRRCIPWGAIRGFSVTEQFVHFAPDKRSPDYRSIPFVIRASLFNRQVIVAQHLHYPPTFLLAILDREKTASLARRQ